MKRISIYILILAIFSLSCNRSVQRIQITDETKYETMKARAKVDYDSKAASGSIDAEIIAKRPGYIRIDVFMPFIGNAARILIQNDNIALYDFVHRQILIPAEDKSILIKNLLGISLSNDQLLDLLLYTYIHPENPRLGDSINIADGLTAIYDSDDLDFPPEIVYLITDDGNKVKIRYTNMFLDEAIEDEIFNPPYLKDADTVYIEAVLNER